MGHFFEAWMLASNMELWNTEMLLFKKDIIHF